MRRSSDQYIFGESMNGAAQFVLSSISKNFSGYTYTDFQIFVAFIDHSTQKGEWNAQHQISSLKTVFIVDSFPGGTCCGLCFLL